MRANAVAGKSAGSPARKPGLAPRSGPFVVNKRRQFGTAELRCELVVLSLSAVTQNECPGIEQLGFRSTVP